MGFFDSLKRNTEIIKAETDIQNISVQMNAIRRSFENYMCVKKEIVQNILDLVNETHRILNAEMLRELDNNTLYTCSMYPNLTSEVSLLEAYRAELKYILETKFPKENT